MSNVLNDLKSFAHLLHQAIRAGDPEPMAWVNANSKQPVAAPDLQRRHILAALARHLGFQGWSHLTAVVGGTADDFGTLLCPEGSHGLNIWSASYAEAKQIQADSGRYLLPWKKQFVLVQADFVESLGIDPSHEDWSRIQRDFAKPADEEARNRLLAQAATARLGGDLTRPEALYAPSAS